MKKFSILCISVLALFVSCQKEVAWVPDGYLDARFQKPTEDYVRDDSFKAVSYCYISNPAASFDTERLGYVTHLHFAFINVNADATLRPLSVQNAANFEALNALAKSKGVKTAVSISALEAADLRSITTIAANVELRKTFINNIVNFVVRNDLDGVDLDWEYPRVNEGSDVTFELLVSELAQELHEWHRYLSIAITAGIYQGAVRSAITQKTMDAVDFVNLMAYDAIGVDPQQPGHHSTLHIAERVLQGWRDRGLPKEKAVLGIPLYGKTAGNTTMTYVNLLANNADPSEDSHTHEGNTYYYNGINTVKSKVELARELGNGVMYWEYNQDARGDNSLMRAAFEEVNR